MDSISLAGIKSFISTYFLHEFPNNYEKCQLFIKLRFIHGRDKMKKMIIISFLFLQIILGCGTAEDTAQDTSANSDVPSHTHVGEDAISKRSTPPDANLDDDESDQLEKHWAKFDSLKKTAPGTARAELAKIARIRFGIHPLDDEWVDLAFSLFHDRKGTFIELHRFLELEIQMLKDADPKKNADRIAAHEVALIQVNFAILSLRQQGKDPAELEKPINFNIR